VYYLERKHEFQDVSCSLSPRYSCYKFIYMLKHILFLFATSSIDMLKRD